MHISEINIYPIKSLKGISLDSAIVGERGLRYDRRWMLTTPDGMFFTQREFPRMALIEVGVDDETLYVTAEKYGTLEIPLTPETKNRQQVTIWQSICDGEIYPATTNEWFSDVLETSCQLVYMPDDSRRSVSSRFDSGGDVVSFADGYPLMVLSEASLEHLNERIAESEKDAGRLPAFRPLPMNRFRPNLVVSGAGAFGEDEWTKVRIGEAEFRSTKPCERCVITTIDQSKGEFAGKEPLKTLASYRRAKNVIPERYESLGVGANAVLFGQNLIAQTLGATIMVGYEVEILES
ncbi:MAG: MOSC N-terminal beta barrel domain-containing protein [Pyrinomonadaceae bacterium]